MAKRIFQVSGVPEREVEDIRHLLQEKKIAFYETPRGNFGLSMAAIWVANDRDAKLANEIISNYQATLGQKKNGHARARINWRLVPWAILLLMVLAWMMVMGYTR